MPGRPDHSGLPNLVEAEDLQQERDRKKRQSKFRDMLERTPLECEEDDKRSEGR